MDEKKRISLRVNSDYYLFLNQYAKERDMSLSELIGTTIDFFIRYKRGDYSLEPLEVARLRELCEHVDSLSERVDRLTELIESLNDSLLLMFRGDNYLIETGDD